MKFVFISNRVVKLKSRFAFDFDFIFIIERKKEKKNQFNFLLKQHKKEENNRWNTISMYTNLHNRWMRPFCDWLMAFHVSVEFLRCRVKRDSLFRFVFCWWRVPSSVSCAHLLWRHRPTAVEEDPIFRIVAFQLHHLDRC